MLVIPKKIADYLKLGEGSIVKITAVGNKIIIEPYYDAVWLSLYGEKIARVTLEELEGESVEWQKKYIEG